MYFWEGIGGVKMCSQNCPWWTFAAILKSKELLYENLSEGIWTLTIKMSRSVASYVSFLSVLPKGVMRLAPQITCETRIEGTTWKSSGNWPTESLWQELSYGMQIVLPHCCAHFNRRGRKRDVLRSALRAKVYLHWEWKCKCPHSNEPDKFTVRLWFSCTSCSNIDPCASHVSSMLVLPWKRN